MKIILDILDVGSYVRFMSCPMKFFFLWTFGKAHGEFRCEAQGQARANRKLFAHLRERAVIVSPMDIYKVDFKSMGDASYASTLK